MNYTFQEAVSYIEKTPKFTQKHGLSYVRLVLSRLGNPQDAFQIIHVAGTNGKGSTCAFLDRIYRLGGYRCGLFTSPHLVDTRERFRIDGELVSQEGFLSAFSRVLSLSQELEREGMGHPTYFEMLFFMGMLIFQEAGVSLVILETGLGGRLDATTAPQHPLLCVITSISLDHMAYLGNTVEEIAREKAGILSEGIPVVYDITDQKAARVIEEEAKRLSCPAYPVSSLAAQILSEEEEGIRFLLEGEEYHIPFPARYQVGNALLAIKCCQVLSPHLSVTKEQIKEGLSSMRWPGRMEKVLPDTLVDGAHNEDGIRAFLQAAQQLSRHRPIALLFSAVSDKNYRAMVEEVASHLSPELVVTTEVGGGRRVPAGELADLFLAHLSCPVLQEKDPAQAFFLARRQKKPSTLLFCVGSLYLAGIIEESVGGSADDRL